VIGHAGERLLDHLYSGRIALLFFSDTPFARLADAEPLQRRVGIGRELQLVGGIDGVWIAGVLKDLYPVDAASDRTGVKRALYPGVGVLLAGDDGLGEFLMVVAPAIDGADAHLKMLGELLVGCAEAAELGGLLSIFGLVEHGGEIAEVRQHLNQGGRGTPTPEVLGNSGESLTLPTGANDKDIGISNSYEF